MNHYRVNIVRHVFVFDHLNPKWKDFVSFCCDPPI